MEEKDKEAIEQPEEIKLPENAYRELKEGEEYKPILLGQKKYPELNAWTITWGIIMAIIFSAAGRPPLTPKLTTPQVPLGMYFFTSASYLPPSSPGYSTHETFG